MKFESVNVFTFKNPSGTEFNNGGFALSPRRHRYLYSNGEAPSTVSLFDFSLKLVPSTIFVSNQRQRQAPIAPETTTLPSSSATAISDDKGAVTFVHRRVVLLPSLLFTVTFDCDGDGGTQPSRHRHPLPSFPCH
ncbi:hypothetical protein PIB30_000533 [Stylosanthes scabra]|uniref:Uncharacterized protein n=1 Tax=Stylosanthes scabra TaxID=79078 RepID=A0ABU6W1Z8_9FABA|nr:hypothetical protein [Stylosanthes scabra]